MGITERREKERFRDQSQDSANEDRTRHLTGRPRYVLRGVNSIPVIKKKTFLLLKIHTNIVGKVFLSQNLTSSDQIKNIFIYIIKYFWFKRCQILR